jgi:hypothetical protein
LEKKGTGSKRIDLLKVYYCPVRETTMHLGTDELRIALINLMFAAAHKTGSGTNRRIAGAQQLGRKRGEADTRRERVYTTQMTQLRHEPRNLL